MRSSKLRRIQKHCQKLITKQYHSVTLFLGSLQLHITNFKNTDYQQHNMSNLLQPHSSHHPNLRNFIIFIFIMLTMYIFECKLDDKKIVDDGNLPVVH